MRTRLLHPLGVEINDVALGDVDPVELAVLLAEHGVAVLRDQDADDDMFLAFLRKLGPLTFTTGETPVNGYPDLNVITNVGRDTPPRSSFHVDTAYVRQPPAYTALRAVEVPTRGGQTLFSDQYAAAADLPPLLRDAVDGRTMTHVVTGLDLTDDEETQADHPLLRPHPVTGRVALYLDAPKRCAAVSGLSAAETGELVGALIRHSTRSDNVLCHSWRPGDVVIWDNSCVLHRADHDGVEGARTMHRGMVTSYGSAA